MRKRLIRSDLPPPSTPRHIMRQIADAMDRNQMEELEEQQDEGHDTHPAIAEVAPETKKPGELLDQMPPISGRVRGRRRKLPDPIADRTHIKGKDE
nr:MAG: hypothetical protein H2Rhizo31535_000007 [Cystoviridae sp.]